MSTHATCCTSLSRLSPTRAPTAHLSLNIAHALIVQFGCGADFKDEPGAEVIIAVEENRERQQEEADEYPPLADQHVFQTPDPDPQQEDEAQSGGAQQRLHDFLAGRLRVHAAHEPKAPGLAVRLNSKLLIDFSTSYPDPSSPLQRDKLGPRSLVKAARWA